MHQWAMPGQPARHDSSINQKHKAEHTAACLGPVWHWDSLPLEKDLLTILPGSTLSAYHPYSTHSVHYRLNVTSQWSTGNHILAGSYSTSLSFSCFTFQTHFSYGHTKQSCGKRIISSTANCFKVLDLNSSWGLRNSQAYPHCAAPASRNIHFSLLWWNLDFLRYRCTTSEKQNAMHISPLVLGQEIQNQHHPFTSALSEVTASKTGSINAINLPSTHTEKCLFLQPSLMA